MAEAPAHKFGQIIGEVLERALEPLLRKFAVEHGLFLDRKGPRPARPGNKVRWKDRYGNIHDLDYVFERGGTAEEIGTPVAFIETAWRRYTKHSRNKAQEIQGAILPLVDTHQSVAPFAGVVLAGVFTEGAITQLKSHGFRALYFPYESVVNAFQRIGIDAFFDEDTSDKQLRRKLRRWRQLPEQERNKVAKALLASNRVQVKQFLEGLTLAVTRVIELVRITPLHGVSVERPSIDDAIAFVQRYSEPETAGPLLRYEVEVRFSNGDRIQGQFADKQSVVGFLRGFQPPHIAAVRRGTGRRPRGK